MVTIWHAEDHATEPSITPDVRERLHTASKTVQINGLKPEIQTKPFVGNALLQDRMTVIFAMVDSDVVIPIHVTDRVVIGRYDFETQEKADIDLMPYGGRDRGVSRRHALLYRTSRTVSLVDFQSSNGTYINGVKLIAHQPRLLREGDEVRLGNLRFHISFENETHT
jgi:pSer/pThr/pTyr-binding forkhead associated (FHA) protein